MKFVERENEVIEIIKKLSGFRIIIVGGYAVSARARHRFSVDCDIVISKKDLKKIGDILIKEGYEKSLVKDLNTKYAGKFIRYVKKINGLPVSVDLLANSLVSRTTNASWSFNYILDNSSKAIIAGIESSVEELVPNKELLLAFKIHSGRKTDLRDIIMLSDADWDMVKEHINRGDLDMLKVQIQNMIKELDNENLRDSLKGVFVLKENIEREMHKTKKNLKHIQKKI